MTAKHNAGEAWKLLRHDNPGVYQEAIFNYRGLLAPGITIQAQIIRRNVEVTVMFEVLEKRPIRYEHMTLPNMWSMEDVQTEFLAHDTGLLPFECYQEKESGPYQEHTLIEFIRKESLEAPDTLGSDGGVDGRIGHNSLVWAPVGHLRGGTG
jgi:hypothetical protein